METTIGLCRFEEQYQTFQGISLDTGSNGAIVLLSTEDQFPDDLKTPTLELLSRIRWGTYGPREDGDIHKLGPGPLKWVTLGDCTTDHLNNILLTQNIPEMCLRAINLILKYRKEENDANGNQDGHRFARPRDDRVGNQE